LRRATSLEAITYQDPGRASDIVAEWNLSCV